MDKISKNLLYNLYIIQNKPSEEIGRMLGYNGTTILRYLHKYNIPIHSFTLNINKRLLYDLYIQQKKSMAKISKILNCDTASVWKYLHKYNIPIRPFKVNLDKRLLYELYITQKKSIHRISSIYHCNAKTVAKYLCKYHIPIRSWRESLKNRPPFTIETRINMSKARIKLGLKGKRSAHYGKPAYQVKRICYKGICMKSTWEVNIAKWLDRIGWEWRYEPKRFELKDRTYLPDFYLPEKNIWWEVKGWFSPRDQETIRQFRGTYPNEKILVLTKSIYNSILLS